MQTPGTPWTIVLAAGDGSRMQSLTTNECGIAVPKQFCSLRGGHSLLQDAIERAASIVATENICVIVAQQHKRWWSPLLAHLPKQNIIVQPQNRGTAIGILLPLLHILARDPDARIVVLPSDHHVADEATLTTALQASLRVIALRRERLLLLGISPDEVDDELGYIVPGPALDQNLSRIRQFIEKPNPTLAREYIDAGALWNAFIVAAQAQILLNLFVRRFPDIVADMHSLVTRHQCASQIPEAAIDLYQILPQVDFSRHVLQGAEDCLSVLRVQPCGWSDLGTPRRLALTLERLPAVDSVSPTDSHMTTDYMNLASQQARYGKPNQLAS
jgi:mannose-1-phosphate guanylyltransferase